MVEGSSGKGTQGRKSCAGRRGTNRSESRGEKEVRTGKTGEDLKERALKGEAERMNLGREVRKDETEGEVERRNQRGRNGKGKSTRQVKVSRHPGGARRKRSEETGWALRKNSERVQKN